MIYRPAPLPEAKAQLLETLVKQKIMDERRQSDIRVLEDALQPAQGRLCAILKRITDLETRRSVLLKSLEAESESPKMTRVDDDIIDAES